MLAVTVSDCGAVPLAGDTESHGASSDALKASDPPPSLATLSVLAAGWAPPATAENASEPGATASRAGSPGPTGRVTSAATSAAVSARS